MPKWCRVGWVILSHIEGPICLSPHQNRTVASRRARSVVRHADGSISYRVARSLYHREGILKAVDRGRYLGIEIRIFKQQDLDSWDGG